MELQCYCHQTVPVPGSSDGVWIRKLDQRHHYAAGSGCRHRGDGRLPGALHLVRRPGGGPAKWRHLSGEQSVCRDDPNGRTMGGALRSGGHAHQLHGNDVNLGGKGNFKATIHALIPLYSHVWTLVCLK